ncbi:MAG: hypothetical protein A2V74_00490 [Acidobacteria bacterium RBG_16_70_10]|nr:MAG: hypothetical protein A2V74_00490 [Acidobacteria bacterium RBG_16_70_10]
MALVPGVRFGPYEVLGLRSVSLFDLATCRYFSASRRLMSRSIRTISPNRPCGSVAFAWQSTALR